MNPGEEMGGRLLDYPSLEADGFAAMGDGSVSSPSVRRDSSLVIRVCGIM